MGLASLASAVVADSPLKRVLVVEDEVSLSQILIDNLQFEGYETEAAHTARAAVSQVAAWKPDLITLDLTLPDRDGFDLCRELSEQHLAPIIIVSALSQQADKVRGFERGAADYVTKPFSLAELLARIRAVLRRADVERDGASRRVTFDDVTIDVERGLVRRAGADVTFTRKELELLRFLARHPGQVFSRDELLVRVWGCRFVPLTRTVDTHMARLRRKLEIDPQSPRRFQSLYGTGYAFTP